MGNWGGRRPGAGRKPRPIGPRLPDGSFVVSAAHVPAPVNRKPGRRRRRPTLYSWGKRGLIGPRLADGRFFYRGMKYQGMGRGGRRPGSGAKPKPLVARVCAECGNQFLCKPSSRKRLCSHSCVHLAQRGRKSASWHGTTKPCRHCGQAFTVTSWAKSRALYCGRPCLMASAKDRMAKFRNPYKSALLRERNRRGSERRRRTSWVAIVGRWRTICERDGWRCWICGGHIDSSLQPPARMAGTVDHVVPLSHGGSDGDENVRAAHFRCNSRRGAGRIVSHNSTVSPREGTFNV